MMVLYSSSTSIFSHRCRFVLFEKGMDFEIKDVDLYNKPEEIMTLNPKGEVPILTDRDSDRNNDRNSDRMLVVNESNLINIYLEERHPHPTLIPVELSDRCRMRAMLLNAEEELFTHVKVLNKYRNKDDEKIRDIARTKLTENLIQLAPFAPKKATSFFCPDIASSPDVINKKVSLIDINLATLLWRLEHYEIELPKQALPLLMYGERIFTKESFYESLTPDEKAMRK